MKLLFLPLFLFLAALPAFPTLAATAAPCAAGFADFESNLHRYTFRWELTHNLPKFREDPSEVMLMPIVKAPRDQIDVFTFGPTSPALYQKFVAEDHVNWPRHPLNTQAAVPFHFARPSGESLPTSFTASRSLLSRDPSLPPVSIKAGTDTPHRGGGTQTAKSFTRDDVTAALLRQPHINAIEKIFPNDDTLLTLPEVLVLREKKSGNGVLVRDLSRIENKNIYVPGLSIPYMGREIARKNKIPFMPFWEEFYAEAVGRAKARLLVNYGLEMETPNAQNILIELSPDFKPTGRVVFRDTVDSHFSAPWLDALGLDDVKKSNAAAGFPANPVLNTRPNAEFKNVSTSPISFFLFDAAGPEGFSEESVAHFVASHDKAWLAEIKHLLGVNPAGVNDFMGMNRFFHSPEGQAALRAYHDRFGTAAALRALPVPGL